MNFITGLPKISVKQDAIWVIVNILTKYAHFLAIKTTNTIMKLARLYVEKIIRFHGIPTFMVSYRYSHFIFGIASKKLLVPTCTSTLLITQKQIGSQNKSFRHQKTCYALTYQTLMALGINTFPFANLLITTTSTLVSVWLYLKLSMIGLVDLQPVGMKLETCVSLYQIMSRKLSKRLMSFESTSSLLRVVKRVMLMNKEGL